MRNSFASGVGEVGGCRPPAGAELILFLILKAVVNSVFHASEPVILLSLLSLKEAASAKAVLSSCSLLLEWEGRNPHLRGNDTFLGLMLNGRGARRREGELPD